ncbi:F-box only protein 33 isoform 5-T5 [Molossus nigricans]
MLLFLSVPQPRPPGARTRAGAARAARWRRRQRLRRQQLRRLRGLLRGLRGRPGAGSRRRGRMALCGQAAGAASLPSELIVHIFSFLPAPDRLRASASCSHWRECLFYPALWPQLRICLRVSPAEQPRLEFLMRKCGWFVRELRVEFAAENYLSGGGGPGDGSGANTGTGGEEVEALQLSTRWLEVLRTYLELVLCVLVSIRNNRNLQKFSLFGDISVLQQQGNLSNTYLSKVDPDGKKIKQIQQLFEEILSNSRQLKWLSCGFMLEIVTPTSLSSLSNSIANTMEHLSLLDNNIPDLSDNRNEDPLVLLAWRCTKLSLLAVHGYTVWAHNLIAIARLRGSNLKVLEVTEESIDFDQGELADQDVDPVHNLIEQDTRNTLLSQLHRCPVHGGQCSNCIWQGGSRPEFAVYSGHTARPSSTPAALPEETESRSNQPELPATLEFRWDENGEGVELPHKKTVPKNIWRTLAGLAQRLERQPAVQRVPGLVPAKVTYLDCSLSPPRLGSCGWQPLNVSLSHHRCFSLSSLSLSLSPSYSVQTKNGKMSSGEDKKKRTSGEMLA